MKQLVSALGRQRSAPVSHPATASTRLLGPGLPQPLLLPFQANLGQEWPPTPAQGAKQPG